MLSYIFQQLLFLSLTGAAVIALCCVLCRWGGRLFSNRWRYYVWLIPAVVLLIPLNIPFLGSTRTAPPAVEYEVRTVTRPSNAAADMAAEESAAAQAAPDSAPTSPAVPRESAVPDAAAPQTARQVPADSNGLFAKIASAFSPVPFADRRQLTAAAAWIWLAGVLFLFLRGAYRRIRFSVNMHRLASPCPAEAEEQFRAVCAEMGVHRKVRLKAFPDSGSPFLSGILRPVVYLPSAELGDLERYAVLKHELTHCRRHDLAVKQLLQIVATLHWFNPLAWLMLKQAEMYCELSCDEAVVRNMDREMRKVYGVAILRLMRGSLPAVSSSAYLAEKKIKNRLEVIMNYSMTGLLKKAVTVLLAVVLGIGSLAFAAEMNGRGQDAQPTTYHAASFWDLTDIRTENAYDVITTSPRDSSGSYHEVKGSATLVNSPFEKSFSADVVRQEFTYTRVNLTDTIIPGEAARYQITMTALDSVLERTGEWVGRFTVLKDGAELMTDVSGVLENVPGLGDPNFTHLTVQSFGEEGRTLSLTGINFGLGQTELMNSAAEKSQDENAFFNDTDTKEIALQLTDGSVIDGRSVYRSSDSSEGEDGEFYSPAYLVCNRNMQQATLSLNVYLEGAGYRDPGYTVSLKREDVISFDGDTLVGTFLLYPFFFDETPREWKGTLTGLSGSIGDAVTLSAEDGSVQLNLTVSPADDEYSQLAFDRRSDWGCITLDELPFALSFTENDVTLSYQGDPSARWGAVLCSYSMPNETWQAVLDENAAGQNAAFQFVPGYHSSYYLVMDVFDQGVYTVYELSIRPQPDGSFVFMQCSRSEDEASQTDPESGLPLRMSTRYR